MNDEVYEDVWNLSYDRLLLLEVFGCCTDVVAWTIRNSIHIRLHACVDCFDDWGRIDGFEVIAWSDEFCIVPVVRIADKLAGRTGFIDDSLLIELRTFGAGSTNVDEWWYICKLSLAFVEIVECVVGPIGRLFLLLRFNWMSDEYDKILIVRVDWELKL